MKPNQVLNRLRLSLPRLAPLLHDDVPMRELALDSMDFVELLCAVHEEFGIRLKEEDLNLRETLTTLAGRICAQTQPLSQSSL